MPLHTAVSRIGLGVLLLAAFSCAATSGQLETGMTPDQAVHALGQPDLKDRIADPHGSGDSVLRYAWLSQGKVATFGPNDRLADISELPKGSAATPGPEIAASGTAAETAPAPAPVAFDPIQTPLNYLFYPLKFGLVWLGAGVNCVAEGQCRRPDVSSPDAG
jgi:hypothetical protein